MKIKKLLLGLGFVVIAAIPLTIVSCESNDAKPPVVEPEKPIPPIEPPISGNVLTKENADTLFANGGKWNGKRELVTSDFEGFTSIGEYALSSRQLRSIELSNEIMSIGDYSFFDNAISNFTFGKKVEHIGAHAFSHNDLIQIVLPSTLKTIGESAFVTNIINSVNIPSSLKIISNNVFAGNQLTTITIPNSITHIGEFAFAGNQLTEVTIPNSVTSIGSMAFEANYISVIPYLPNGIPVGDIFNNQQRPIIYK